MTEQSPCPTLSLLTYVCQLGALSRSAIYVHRVSRVNCSRAMHYTIYGLPHLFSPMDPSQVIKVRKRDRKTYFGCVYK